MELDAYNEELLTFISDSPTPFHAVANMVRLLEQHGFEYLSESEVWTLIAGKRYYTTRNGSSIIAFVYGNKNLSTSGIRIVGAHTDSPCLKVKPNPVIKQKNHLQLGVEVYGGALLNPWFDRDLSLAGRVSFKNTEGELQQTLLDFKKPIGLIPSLAIHMDRDANLSKSINAQKDLPVLISQLNEGSDFDYQEFLKNALTQAGESAVEILDAEMLFYDYQQAAITGLENQYISSARLDNLLSCFVGLQALLQSTDEQSSLLICNDHEEVGSCSASGAQGPMFKDFLTRLVKDDEQRFLTLHHSMMVSLDNAHALHPNFSEKHDANHGPLLNQGPVIKVNASQRYASNAESQSIFRHIAKQVGETVQNFVVRSDMGCGSTIGPITAAELGVLTVDVGIPQLAMHSIREVCGSRDPFVTGKILKAFYEAEKVRV